MVVSGIAVSRRVDVLHVMNSLPEKFKESIGSSLFSYILLLWIQSFLLELKATSVGLSQLTFRRPTLSLSSKTPDDGGSVGLWNIICREKVHLDATQWFNELVICSTCFGHYYAHHQVLETIQVITACCT